MLHQKRVVLPLCLFKRKFMMGHRAAEHTKESTNCISPHTWAHRRPRSFSFMQERDRNTHDRQTPSPYTENPASFTLSDSQPQTAASSLGFKHDNLAYTWEPSTSTLNTFSHLSFLVWFNQTLVRFLPLGVILLGRCDHSNCTRCIPKQLHRDPLEEVMSVWFHTNSGAVHLWWGRDPTSIPPNYQVFFVSLG